MIKDGVFLSNEITIANMEKLSKRQSQIAEQRICELAELAFDAAADSLAMMREGYGIYEVLSVISEVLSTASSTPHTHAMAGNLERLASYLKIADSQDKIVFSDLFTESLRKGGVDLSEKDFLPDESGDETFTYVKNPLADEAYDVFSQDFSNPRVKYSASLSDAARAVGSGEVEYALLPLEERGGARLASAAALLFRDDLKINSVTPVFGSDGVADMKYALVSKHFTVPNVLPDDDRYLEIRLRQDLSVSLAELFSAADTLGISLYRVNTISFDTEDGAISHYSIVFRDEGKDFSAFLVYLTLFSGAYTPIGIYKNLE